MVYNAENVCATRATTTKKGQRFLSCPLTPLGDPAKQVDLGVAPLLNTFPLSFPTSPLRVHTLVRCAGSGSGARCFPADRMESRTMGRCGEKKVKCIFVNVYESVEERMLVGQHNRVPSVVNMVADCEVFSPHHSNKTTDALGKKRPRSFKARLECEENSSCFKGILVFVFPLSCCLYFPPVLCPRPQPLLPPPSPQPAAMPLADSQNFSLSNLNTFFSFRRHSFIK